MINIENISDALGVSISAVYVLLIIVVFLIAYLSSSIKESKRNTFLGWSILAVILFLLTTGGVTIDKDIQEGLSGTDNVAWQDEYNRTASAQIADYTSLIENTDYYNYNHENVASVASYISHNTETPKEAIIETLKYVYNHIDYVPNEADSACQIGTAPEILSGGKGQCDTQSMVVVAILRKMGIAAKPVGGCLSPGNDCPIQSVVKAREPKFQEVELDGDEFSRTGGLHAWVTAWDPEEGWLNLESTNGLIADTSCWTYHVELYVEDDSKSDLCVSKNRNYASGCKYNDIDKMSEYGLGLATEVTP